MFLKVLRIFRRDLKRTKKAAYEVIPRFEYALRRGNYDKNYWRIWHYSTIVAAFFGPVLFRLHKIKLRKNDYHTFALLGASTALFDRVYDEDLIDSIRFREVLQSPKIADSILEKLVTSLLVDLINANQQPELFSQFMIRMALAQEESKAQEDNTASKKFLENITRKKGGTGYLVFRSYVPVHLTSSEEEALMQIGNVVQMLDDLVDGWQDEKDGIRTLFHTYQTPQLFFQEIERQAADMETAIAYTDWNPRQRKLFVYSLRYCLIIGDIYSSRLTQTLKKTQRPLTELEKHEAIFHTDFRFWVKLIRYIMREEY